MRSIIIGATALLLLGSAVAEPADPTQLAEAGAYLLGNAHRCGVAAMSRKRGERERQIG